MATKKDVQVEAQVDESVESAEETEAKETEAKETEAKERVSRIERLREELKAAEEKAKGRNMKKIEAADARIEFLQARIEKDKAELAEKVREREHAISLLPVKTDGVGVIERELTDDEVLAANIPADDDVDNV